MKASLWGSWESAESRVRPIRRIVRVFNGMTPPPAPQNSVCSRVLTCALLQQHGRGWGWGAGVRRASTGRADTAGALGHRAACQPRGGPGLWRQHRNRFIGKAGSEAPHTLPSPLRLHGPSRRRPARPSPHGPRRAPASSKRSWTRRGRGHDPREGHRP